MRDRSSRPKDGSDFDFSTPEGERAVRIANELLLEVVEPLAKKVILYERTLGLAVVPVLVRRWLLAMIAHRSSRRRS